VTARFRRLTEAEARTLPFSELTDRCEAEQAYWGRKQNLTPEDEAARREFSRILFTVVVDRTGQMMQDLTAQLRAMPPPLQLEEPQ
jgi:hypothetical protein